MFPNLWVATPQARHDWTSIWGRGRTQLSWNSRQCLKKETRFRILLYFQKENSSLHLWLERFKLTAN